MKHLWLIDNGHGGIIDGKYVTAPSKMYIHDDDNIFYEGVFNRIIKNLLVRKLKRNGLHYIDLCPTQLDLDLDVRVDIANAYYKKYGNAVLLSLHSNAGGGRGFEVWTSVGQTRSDIFAEILGGVLRNTFSGSPFRADTSDGDLDKESQFYILKHTKCPAILPECLFFDNWDDYQLLQDPAFRIAYVNALFQFIKQAEHAHI